MKSLRMLLIGAALITGGSALASAQPMEHHDNGAYSDHDRDRDRNRDSREFRDHERDDRRVDRNDRYRDRDDRRVYEQRRAHWDGYRWVY